MQVKNFAECSKHSAILSTFIKLPFVFKIFFCLFLYVKLFILFFYFQALCGVGQCLQALSTHESPDPPLQWIVQEMVGSGRFLTLKAPRKNASENVVC